MIPPSNLLSCSACAASTSSIMLQSTRHNSNSKQNPTSWIQIGKSHTWVRSACEQQPVATHANWLEAAAAASGGRGAAATILPPTHRECPSQCSLTLAVHSVAESGGDGSGSGREDCGCKGENCPQGGIGSPEAETSGAKHVFWNVCIQSYILTSETFQQVSIYWPLKRFINTTHTDHWNVSRGHCPSIIETFHVVTSTTSLKRFTETMSIIEPFRVIIVSQLLTFVASTKSYYFLFEITSIIVPM